jgi:hypothetical protein
MKALINNRVELIEKQFDDNEIGKPPERMKSRLCDFVSLHQRVLMYDQDHHGDLKESERIDIEQEMFNKEKTYYKTYAEIKVCSKISTTNWDDSFNVSWETLIEFYKKFKHKWDPIDFIKRRKLNNKERFLFYNFFNECIYIYDCKVNVDLTKLDFELYKFENIYLNLEEIK